MECGLDGLWTERSVDWMVCASVDWVDWIECASVDWMECGLDGVWTGLSVHRLQG